MKQVWIGLFSFSLLVFFSLVIWWIYVSSVGGDLQVVLVAKNVV